MLHFFRKYQRFFFLIVTIVIVISFSFFGVMNTMMNTPTVDPDTVSLIDGRKVKRSELEAMALFLGTDAKDKQNWGGAWGPNFLNDGMVQNEFLRTGLILEVAAAFPHLFEKDLNTRASKERRFTLYRHPKADFISVESAWGYLAPEMKNQYRTMQIGENPLSKEELQARVNLYLGERALSPLMVKQMLMYQKKQYSWVPEDPNLARADLSLFGYHTFEDWFGSRMLRLLSLVVLNGAKEAERQGFHVSDAEALYTLQRNAERSFADNRGSRMVNVENANSYLKEQLRRMQMPLGIAIETTRQILLFKRLYDGASDSVLTNAQPFEDFAKFAAEKASGEIYQFPEELHFSRSSDLGMLEVYMDAVAVKPSTPSLLLPSKFKTAAEVEKKTPELVQRKWKLQVQSIDLRQLNDRIAVRDLWEWETATKNWKVLTAKYSELDPGILLSEEKRFDLLEQLPKQKRDQIDRHALALMLKEHPDWISEALSEKEVEERIVAVRKKGETPFKGVNDAAVFGELLVKAERGDATALKELQNYSQDGKTFFRIAILEKAPQDEILSFKEVRKDNTLRQLYEKRLTAHYDQLKSANPEKYRGENGEFKSLTDVREQVVRDYLKEPIQEIQQREKTPNTHTLDEIASLRLKAHMRWMKEKAQQGSYAPWIVAASEVSDEVTMQPNDLRKQWAVQKSDYATVKSAAQDDQIEKALVFGLEPGQWSEVHSPSSGALSFFVMEQKSSADTLAVVNDSVETAKSILSDSVKEELLRTLLSQMKQREEELFEYLLPQANEEITPQA